MNRRLNLLLLLSLVTTNIYVTDSYTLTANIIAQWGYNNRSEVMGIGDHNIDSIDPNALNGWNYLKQFVIYSDNLLTIDLEVFKRPVNLEKLGINCRSLNKITNSRNVKLFNLTELTLMTNLTSLNKPLLNAFPALRSFTTGRFYFTRIDNIKTIDVHTFEDLSNLTTIDLANNFVTGFEYLQIPKNLRSLDLGWNRMNYFALSRTMGVLDYLDISNNRFRSFKSMDFTFLANLTYLDLSYNPHAYPYEIPGHLKPLVKLRQIDLRSLNITSIEPNYFRNNTKLKSIDLSYNKLNSLDYRAFNGLNDLDTLLLGDNNLTKISSGTFNNPNLTRIDLRNNEISHIDNSSFYGYSSSLDVNLHNNKLKKILPRTFINTFDIIWLNGNEITEIDNSTFDGIIGEISLELPYNKIEKIGPGSFNNLKIGTLRLSNNLLTELKNGSFAAQIVFLDLMENRIEKIEEGAFKYATITDRIWLGYNNLTEINATMFAGQNQLQRIDLDNNKLSKIEPGSFANLPNLTTVILENNELTQLDSSMFAGSNKLNTIILNGNPNLSTANMQSLCPPAATNCHVFYE